jgi:hypothetical protein
MSVFIGFMAFASAMLLSFSDKIIEYISPRGDLAQVEEETDDVILHIEEEDEPHEV